MGVFDSTITITFYLAVVPSANIARGRFNLVRWSRQPEFSVHLQSYSMYFGDKVIEKNQIMLDQHKGLYCWVKSRAGAR